MKTGTAGSDETDTLTGGGVTLDGGGVANVLVVTTTVRVLNRVHGNTTDLGPLVTLDAVLVEGSTGLEEGLVHAATTGDEADHGAACRGEDLLVAGGEGDLGLAVVEVVDLDGAVLTRGLGDLTAVTGGLLKAAHNGTLGHGAEGEDVTDIHLCLSTSVDELTGVGTLGGDHKLLVLLELVRVAEGNDGKGGTTTRVVDDVLHDTLEVAMALAVVVHAELCGTLASVGVRLCNSPNKQAENQ